MINSYHKRNVFFAVICEFSFNCDGIVTFKILNYFRTKNFYFIISKFILICFLFRLGFSCFCFFCTCFILCPTTCS
ncbi:hypothetical protein SAMD00023518_00886 [Listeria monocytogenes]|nr:hypothetical protein SAMD00023518_00886 [Listeria monocytogenes]